MGFESDSNFPPELGREDRYVLHNYYRLTTWAERCMHRLRLAQMRGDEDISKIMKERMGRVWGTAMPPMAHLESLPLAEFLHNVATRIRQEHAERIQWSKCPYCAALARTPRAHLCPDCGKTW